MVSIVSPVIVGQQQLLAYVYAMAMFLFHSTVKSTGIPTQV